MNLLPLARVWAWSQPALADPSPSWGSCSSRPLSHADSCPWLPAPPTPGLPVFPQSNPASLGPACRSPQPASVACSFWHTKGHKYTRASKGLLQLRLCVPVAWPCLCPRGPCAHCSLPPHPPLKASGDFLALPSECFPDLTTCCQAACLLSGLDCPGLWVCAQTPGSASPCYSRTF